MKILHVISGLGQGGAQEILQRLICKDTENSHVVVSLSGDGLYGVRLREQGTPTYLLDLSSFTGAIFGLYNYMRLLRQLRPDVIQTWMYHADLCGGTVAWLMGRRSIVWNIRRASIEATEKLHGARFVASVCARLSRTIPRRIVCCGTAAMDWHSSIGYDSSRMVLIQNGVSDVFFSRGIRRREPQLQFAIGSVTRYHLSKDPQTLIETIKLVMADQPDIHWRLAGAGMSRANIPLVQALSAAGVYENVELLGPVQDVAKFMSEIDLHLTSSQVEGFPNAIAEAMAAGTPCVTTDVGAAAQIVGNTGWVVPRQNPAALAEATLAAYREATCCATWEVRQESARAHIASNYSLRSMVAHYRRCWKEVARATARNP